MIVNILILLFIVRVIVKSPQNDKTAFQIGDYELDDIILIEENTLKSNVPVNLFLNLIKDKKIGKDAGN